PFPPPDALPTLPSPPSLHDALPILPAASTTLVPMSGTAAAEMLEIFRKSRRENPEPSSVGFFTSSGIPNLRKWVRWIWTDQEFRSEGTRLNSSHLVISYAVFCLKKK